MFFSLVSLLNDQSNSKQAGVLSPAGDSPHEPPMRE
jgi:hypothetical protein